MKVVARSVRKPLSAAFVPHARVTSDPVGDSLTKQEFLEESDINQIMRNFERTGMVPMSPHAATPRFMDCTDVPSLQRSLEIMSEAEAAFMSLPGTVRAEFDNNAMAFVEFASDPENLDQMRKWGLAPPEKLPDSPARVEVVAMPPLDQAAPGASGGQQPAK